MIMALFSQPITASDINSEKQILIDRFLEQNGQSPANIGRQFAAAFIQQITDSLNETDPDIEPKAFTIVEEEVQKLIYSSVITSNRLQSLMYPIYHRYFTSSDLRAIVEFNQTAAGRKLLKVMPLVVHEGLQVGRVLGDELRPKIYQRISDQFGSSNISWSGSGNLLGGSKQKVVKQTGEKKPQVTTRQQGNKDQ